MAAKSKAGVVEAAPEEKMEEVKQEPAEQEQPAQEAPEQTEKAVISAPNSNYCGNVGGVNFTNGKAELEISGENMRMLHWFKENGYQVGYEVAYVYN